MIDIPMYYKRGIQTRLGGGGVLPYRRLMGICRWMGSHFHDWIDFYVVAFSTELLEWGRTFSDFCGKTVLHIYGKQAYQNVCTVGEKESVLQHKNRK